VVKTVTFAVPGDLETQTGGYIYDRRIIVELRGLGWTVEVLDIGEGFPRPSAQVRAKATALLSAVPPRQLIIIDGLAFGVLPAEARVLRCNHPLVALVHHPLAFETGVNAAEAAVLRGSERNALTFAHRIVVTSHWTGKLLETDFRVPIDRITVVRPGTDRGPSSLPKASETVALLSVGAVTPRKGYDVLVAALAKLRNLSWRLTIAGDRMRSSRTAAELDRMIDLLGLTDRVSCVGQVGQDMLNELYTSADVFVLPSRFEGYGMAFSEAIVRGLPVVGTTAGAIPGTVPEGAGVLVPPDNVDALVAALGPVIKSLVQRRMLAAGARAAAVSFPSWRESAKLFAQVLDTLA
jgi:glycosyltransferase involved in cell wall biosynthesis